MQAFFLDTVDSTNEEAGRLLREGRIGDFAIIVARRQSAGKGTRGRSWISPLDAGIYLTVVDRPDQAGGELHAFTRAAGVACAETLVEHAGVEVRLKPINDLYVDGRKLGGILNEAIIEGGRMRALITGVGINVRRAERALPPDHAVPITLEELMPPYTFAELDVRALTVALAERIRTWNAVTASGDLRALDAAWRVLGLVPDPAAEHEAFAAPDRIEMR